MKKFILNADDLGKSKFHNSAVLEGFKNGILKSASVMVNMPDYKDALLRVIQPNPALGIGLHFNIIEGRALCSNLNLLTDCSGNFNNNYLNLILKSQSKSFLEQIEREFRTQIECALNDGINLTHVDSHVHTHAIPKIFDLISKLCTQYGIKQLRMQAEPLYFVKNKKYKIINLLKVLLLNYFSLQNKTAIKKYNLKTNDCLIGINYTGMMDSDIIKTGLKTAEFANITEALIHPCFYCDGTIDSHSKEFEITKDISLKNFIENLGYEISNYLN